MALLRFLFLHPPGPASIVGWVFFALLVWFGGPMLSLAGYQPLAGIVARVAVIMLTPVLSIALRHRAWRQSQTANLKFVESLLAASSDGRVDRTSDGRKVLSREAAFEYLAFGGDPLLAREKPWFFVLGGHGCGKSSIVRNSAVMPNHYVGSGITREYDWWTNVTGAPLLEIPISQVCDVGGDNGSSDEDEKARLLRDVVQGSDWRQFLDAVAKGRPQQPVNGLLLVVSLAELARGDVGGLAERAAMLRNRLNDLEQRLCAQVPCYLLFSKADSIPGFATFFDGLSPDEHNHIWGVTFKLSKGRDMPIRLPSTAEIDGELALLVQQLNRPRLRRLAAERDLTRRFEVFGFPQQFAGVTGRVGNFVRELIRKDAAGRPITVRGLYFCSALTRVDERNTKSFFIPGIFNRVVLREADLVRSRGRFAGIRRRMSSWFRPLLFVVLTAFIGILTLDYYLVRGQIAAIQVDLQTFQSRVERASEAAVVDEEGLAKALDSLHSAGDRAADPPFPLGALGLYDPKPAAAAAQRAYRRALNEYLLPHIRSLMETQLRAPWMAPGALRELLDLYQMLDGTRAMQADAISAWLRRNLMAGHRFADGRHPLARHADVLLRGRLAGAQIDHSLVDDVTQRLSGANRP